MATSESQYRELGYGSIGNPSATFRGEVETEGYPEAGFRV